ncbi:MAG: hypothetical protein ABJI69_09110 [Balneola sp.]
MSTCEAPYCQRIPQGNRKHCARCRKRLQRQNHPFRYFFNQHKQKAKQRGIDWLLTFEEFRQLWLAEPEKWLSKLSGATSHWEIDRVNNNLPYHITNVQIITKTKNVQKYYEHDRFMMDVTWTDKIQPKPNYEEAPF